MTIRSFKRNMSRKYKARRLILFGSRARGSQRKDSDFDILVVADGFRNMDRMERAARMYDHWTFPYGADFLCYTPAEFNRLKGKSHIIMEALRDGVEV